MFFCKFFLYFNKNDSKFLFIPIIHINPMERELKKGLNFFLIVGIPSLIFLVLFSIIVFLGGFLILWGYGLALYFAMMHRKLRKHPFVRLSKFSIVMFLIGVGFLIMSFSPAAMTHQFQVNINKSGLIEPDHPIIAELENQFDLWLETEPYVEDAYGLNYSDGMIIPYQYEDAYYFFRTVNFSEIEFDDLDSITQLLIINYYITEVVIEWTSDSIVYDSGEYKGTVEQVLAVSISSNWTEKSTDDCDGIAIVTVSLLQRMGYTTNAYIGSGKGHWYTVVEPRDGIDNFSAPIFLNTWRPIHVWYYFNQYETKLGQPIMDTIQDVWLLDEENTDFKAFLDIVRDQYLLVFGVVLFVSIIGVLLIKYPRKRDDMTVEIIIEQRNTRKEKLQGNKIIGQKWNPLYWLAWITYGRVGNPVQKSYWHYWLDVVCTTIVLFIAAICTFYFETSPYPSVYSALVLFLIVYILDTDYFIKIKDIIKKKVVQKER